MNVVEVLTVRRSSVTSGKQSRNPEFIGVRTLSPLAGELAFKKHFHKYYGQAEGRRNIEV